MLKDAIHLQCKMWILRQGVTLRYYYVCTLLQRAVTFWHESSMVLKQERRKELKMTFTTLFEKYGHMIGKDEITGKWLVDYELGYTCGWKSFRTYDEAIEWAKNND